MPGPILEVKKLVTELGSRRGPIRVVDEVSLHIAPGEIVGLVGESGSGKSMTAFSLLQLFPTRAARVTGGQILFEGRDLRTLKPEELRRMRGERLSMIFQDPSSFLDPLMPIGKQVGEPLLVHQRRAEVARRVPELLSAMGLPDADTLTRRYPHQLSGGQRQRVLIAGAIACQPGLLIADEPTTALDVTVQAQILALLEQLRRDTGLAILLITHDLGIVAEVCDRVYVMYAGRIVESNTTDALFNRPRHPYTQGLLRSTLSAEAAIQELFSIPGTVPNLAALPEGCAFRTRCPLASEICLKRPELIEEDGGEVACWNSAKAVSYPVWENLGD